jgi:hypothetical protein
VAQLPPYQRFPVEALPPILSEYIAAQARAIGCDPALVALPALATVAGAIGNARAVVLKKGWSEPAVVWALTVAESGGLKSPAWHAASHPLMELQCDAYDKHQEATEEHKREVQEWAERDKNERGERPTPPIEPPSYVTSDATIEVVGELLREAPKGLLLSRDELDGWFQSFTRYKSKAGGSDRAQWLEMHRAGTLRVDRITREKGRLVVRRACVSVTGTIQPTVLAKSFGPEAMEAGLAARFLLAMPPKPRRVWNECEVEEHVADEYSQLLRRLLALDLADKRKRKPHYLGLSLAAQHRWRCWFNEWGEAQFEAEGEQASAFAKIEAYTARLALLHHVVSLAARNEGGSKSAVTEGSMAAAITLARWFAREVARVYGMLRESEEDRQARRLVEWVRAHAREVPGCPGVEGVTVRQLQNSNTSRWPTKEAAEAGLDEVVSCGLGEWVEEAERPEGGHRRRWLGLLPPTSDTSDTCPDGGAEGASDTRPDGQHQANEHAPAGDDPIPY